MLALFDAYHPSAHEEYVGDNVIGVTAMTAIIALIGHLDGGGASTFLIVVPAMLPV